MNRSGFVGKPIKRVEDPRFLRGMATYTEEIRLPNMLHVAFLRSPHAHARIKSIDIAPALAIAGVRQVFTGEDVAGEIKPLGLAMRRDAFPPSAVKDIKWPCLALDKVRYTGEPVAAIVADSRYLAEDGADLVEVCYEVLPNLVDPEKAMQSDAPVIHEEFNDNIALHLTNENGNVDKAFKEADIVIRERFQTNRHFALPMEGRATLAKVDADNNLTLWTSSQNPFVVRTRVAEVLDFPEHRLRVITPDVGGGFGMKAIVIPEEALTCFFALKLGVPVRWIEDRHEHFLSAFHSKDELIDAEMAFTKSGVVLGARVSVVGDIGAYSADPWPSPLEPTHVAVAFPGPYQIRNYAYDVKAVCTNKTTLSTYRGVGQPAAVWAHERLMDVAARRLGLDAAEIRRRNLIKPHEFPCVSVSGLPYDSSSSTEALERALEMCSYHDFRQRQEDARQRGVFMGIGIGNFIEMTTYAARWAASVGYEPAPFEAANIRMEPNGGVVVRVGTLCHGQGHYTTWAQIVADELGIGVDDVQVIQGDTHHTPYGWGTFGSRSTVAAGGALVGAASEVRKKMLRTAALLMEVDTDDLELVRGKVQVKGAPAKSISIPELARSAVFAAWRGLPSGQSPGLESTYYFDPPGLVFSNGVHIAEVSIDIETGLVKIDRYTVVEDCGRVINPLIVEGQIAGGVAQGIGNALFEHLLYDENGQLLTTSLMDYLTPCPTDVPKIQIGHIETNTPLTSEGWKGMGESGAIGAPAAVSNAVADALKMFDARVNELPLTPERIWTLTRT